MSIKYRALDSNGDYCMGRGLGDYLYDTDAVAQACKTRLLLFLGEWWEDIRDGLPFFERIAGRRGYEKNMAALIIRKRILGTPDVTDVKDIKVEFDANTRLMSFQATVSTVYGDVEVVL